MFSYSTKLWQTNELEVIWCSLKFTHKFLLKKAGVKKTLNSLETNCSIMKLPTWHSFWLLSVVGTKTNDSILTAQEEIKKLLHLKWRKFIYSFFDSFRRYGTKCSGCGQGIAPSDLVRKPRDKVFHLNCFTCCICRKQLSTGEQLYVLDDNKFICKDDYMLGKGSHHHLMTGELLTLEIFKILLSR